MIRRLAMALMAMAAGTGCASPPRVVDRDAVGPYGEHLLKLQCDRAEQCRALARETCGGEFEVVRSETVSSGFGHAPPGTAQVLFVHCGPVPPGGPASRASPPPEGSR